MLGCLPSPSMTMAACASPPTRHETSLALLNAKKILFSFDLNVKTALFGISTFDINSPSLPRLKCPVFLFVTSSFPRCGPPPKRSPPSRWVQRLGRSGSSGPHRRRCPGLFHGWLAGGFHPDFRHDFSPTRIGTTGFGSRSSDAAAPCPDSESRSVLLRIAPSPWPAVIRSPPARVAHSRCAHPGGKRSSDCGGPC